jgi:hypothetical protein
MEENTGIQAIPAELDMLIDWQWPNALMVGATRHSDSVYSVYILDLDYTYTKWLASLSLDHRWSLSPREGPWENDSQLEL